MVQIRLTERGRDVFVVLGSLLVIGVSLWLVAPMLAAAWTRDAFVWNATYLVVEGLLGQDIDIAVVGPTGMLLIWIVLFATDGYKTTQGLILLFFGFPAFVALLWLEGVWLEEVSWLDHWWAGLLGIVVGVLTGILRGSTGTDLDPRQFPAATAGLYLVTALVLFVGFWEVHLDYTSPWLWNRRTEQLATGPVGEVSFRTAGLARDILGSLLLIGVLGVFTQYSSNTTIRVVSPSDVAGTLLLGGLFAYAEDDDDYSGVAGTADSESGARDLKKVVRADSRDDVSDDIGPAEFKFRRGGWFSRRKVIRLDIHDPPQPGDVEYLETKAERRKKWYWKAGSYVSVALRMAVPNWLRPGRGREQLFLARLDRADVLLLVVPFDELVDPDDEKLNDVDPPAGYGDNDPYTELYDRIGEAYEDVPNKDVVVVLTGSETARELLERQEGSSVTLQPGSADLDKVAGAVGIEECTVRAFDCVLEDDTDPSGADDILDDL
ncbi:hypothetical protein [Haloplanus rubicundus]|uniref:Uncharacterized protein n=1 Tax=Haloplanus rubicundus TaxID=1547898 RepID=A0A345E850_9EURY|nr:hypothetical protein [Haloplanus rubicundus]AXG08372.1 hypothetical protein DU484_00055 [Haloplanus rubicundus]